MKLKIITPNQTLFEGKIQSINIAERTESFSILNGHAPLMTVIKDFVSTVQAENGELIYMAANLGTLKVLNNEASLIIDHGVMGASKEQARANLAHLKKEIENNQNNLGDDTIANLEIKLMRMTRDLGR